MTAARDRAISRGQWLWFRTAAFLFILAQSSALAQTSCCSGSGCCGGPHGQACTLTYGARGVVRDSVTGAPIVGATIAVLDTSGTSAADGSFDVSAARPETCNVDYYYSLRVTASGYNTYDNSLYTSSVFPTLTIELDRVDPNATPTPTFTVYPGPSVTVTVCPAKTPCVIGEQPRPCDQHCGLGCGCEVCPECPPGRISAPRANFCECVLDPNVTPGPTSTPGNCFFPTPPLCPVGQTAQCLTEGGCDSHCSCIACDACPDGLAYSGEPNSCLCLDPRTVTVTPTPETRTSTPTPDICRLATPPLCPAGETPHCIQPDCLIGCRCEPCNDCPEGLVFSGEPNRCDCVDPRTPSQRPTPTPTPASPDTPRACQTRTPLACDEGEATVCDTAVDPCGICECRAVPQQPGGDDSALSPHSSGGCAVVGSRDAQGSLWSWSFLLVAAIVWRSAHCPRD